MKKGFHNNVPNAKFYLHDFSKSSIHSIGGASSWLSFSRFHVVLLCEVLEHLYEGPAQMHLVRDAAMFVLPGGSLHITHPAIAELDPDRTWGHKCEHVPRQKVMAILEQNFHEVRIALSENRKTIHYFATGKTEMSSKTWADLARKYDY